MKKLSILLIGACMAMASAVAAADGALFYEDPVYTVVSYDSTYIDEHSDAAIMRTMKMHNSIADNENDKDQMIYSQVNCDRCHTDKTEPSNAIAMFSMNEKQLTAQALDHRYRF